MAQLIHRRFEIERKASIDPCSPLSSVSTHASELWVTYRGNTEELVLRLGELTEMNATEQIAKLFDEILGETLMLIPTGRPAHQNKITRDFSTCETVEVLL